MDSKILRMEANPLGQRAIARALCAAFRPFSSLQYGNDDLLAYRMLDLLWLQDDTAQEDIIRILLDVRGVEHMTSVVFGGWWIELVTPTSGTRIVLEDNGRIAIDFGSYGSHSRAYEIVCSARAKAFEYELVDEAGHSVSMDEFLGVPGFDDIEAEVSRRIHRERY